MENLNKVIGTQVSSAIFKLRNRSFLNQLTYVPNTEVRLPLYLFERREKLRACSEYIMPVKDSVKRDLYKTFSQ